ncbi:hypothetical protein F0P96_04655 [Hymenobacter busanensis]|uniref:Uncharacterized protein n=1 Tax=Hymenobacter busanensis TaxID=2607656 RepID=A0AA88FJN4_9BACT|nr:hypothetical protein F0P96_04655 [Hymenobacter busanensis]
MVLIEPSVVLPVVVVPVVVVASVALDDVVLGVVVESPVAASWLQAEHKSAAPTAATDARRQGAKTSFFMVTKCLDRKKKCGSALQQG